MGDVLLILGSPRAGGNTAAAAECLRAELSLASEQFMDLRLCKIEPFAYDAELTRDDFHAVFARILDHQQLVFATPVYWYAMSGLMKTFFDHLTDLLLDAEARRLGRALAGRCVWLLATGTDETLPDGFTVPFEKTASSFLTCAGKQHSTCRSMPLYHPLRRMCGQSARWRRRLPATVTSECPLSPVADISRMSFRRKANPSSEDVMAEVSHAADEALLRAQPHYNLPAT